VAEEEGDLLGGLPRSRPGVRSGKRAGAAGAGRANAGAAGAGGSRPKPRAAAARGKRTGQAGAGSAGQASGPAEEALRLASGAAGAVFGTASSVTRGILRRLPKP
jgi:hypothetical protein